MFFIFSPPCTKNAKSDLIKFFKIKDSWSFIRLRLKNRISCNETIEIGERDGMKNVRDELYPTKENYSIEKRSKRVAKNDEENQTDLDKAKLLKSSIREPNKPNHNALTVYRVTAQYGRLVNFDCFFYFEV